MKTNTRRGNTSRSTKILVPDPVWHMSCLSLPPCDQDPISDGGRSLEIPSGDTLVQDVLKNMDRQGLTSC